MLAAGLVLGSAAAQPPAAGGRVAAAQKVDPPAPPRDGKPGEPKVDRCDPKNSRLPTREAIFGYMFDDAGLERAIIEATRRNLQATENEEAQKKGQKPRVFETPVPFPEVCPLVPDGTPYVAKTGRYAPSTALIEPFFVVHRRLHFEEHNSERYGWDLGFIGPLVSTAAFYKDVLLWPNSLASGLEVGFWDTSAGKCLPGTPVPYYLYPPHLTITGITTEIGVITAGSFLLHPVGGGNAIGPFGGR